MFTAPQSDPVTFWQPSFSLPNVIVVAGEKTTLAPQLASVCPPDATFDMVHVTTPVDALPLVQRGRISALVLVEPGQGEGWSQLLIEALERPKTPRVLILAKRAPYTWTQGWIRLHPAVADAAAFRGLLTACLAESQRPPDRGVVTPADFFRAACCLEEAAWVRITADAGTGDLCYRAGQAVYAEAGRKSGRAAADEMLGWGDSSFEYRDFPAVLPSNLTVALAELSRATPPAAAAPAAAAPAPAPAPAEAAGTRPAANDLEEPDEFPSFGEAAEMATAGGDLDIEEPTEFPDLAMPIDATAMDVAAPGDGLDVDSPPFPEFEAGAEPFSAPAAQEAAAGGGEPVIAAAEEKPKKEDPPKITPADFGMRSTIFLSVALIENGVIETCEPASNFGNFDAAAIYHLFHGMERYAQQQSMGATNSVMLRAVQTSLVVARVPGTAKILAARLSGSKFGAAEEMELNRLLEQATAPIIFR